MSISGYIQERVFVTQAALGQSPSSVLYDLKDDDAGINKDPRAYKDSKLGSIQAVMSSALGDSTDSLKQ